MSKDTLDTGTTQARWARFRFAIIGPLLASPPADGELQRALADLAKKQWQDPITGLPASFSASTIERWFYRAQKEQKALSGF